MIWLQIILWEAEMYEIPWDENHPHYYLTDTEFFGKEPHAAIDFWSKAAHWSPDEGVALSFGYDPRVVNWGFLAGSGHPFAKTYEYRIDLALRARDMGQLQERNEPITFVKWVKGLGLTFCPELEEALCPAGKDEKAKQVS